MVRPDLSGALGIDQLHVDHYAVTLPPHTTLQDICHAKRFTDGAQVLCCSVAKLHHRRTADDSEIFDLCQTREDVVLNAVCKKRIVLIRAEVLKRKHRDGFLRRERPYSSLFGIEPNAKTTDGDQESSGREQETFASKNRW